MIGLRSSTLATVSMSTFQPPPQNACQGLVLAPKLLYRHQLQLSRVSALLMAYLFQVHRDDRQ